MQNSHQSAAVSVQVLTNESQKIDKWWKIYLAMDEYDWTEQSPCATLSVNVEHTENLQKSNATNRTRCENLSIASQRKYDKWSYHNNEICKIRVK